MLALAPHEVRAVVSAKEQLEDPWLIHPAEEALWLWDSLGGDRLEG